LTVLGEQDIRSHGLFGLALVLNLREFGSPLVLPISRLRWELLVQLTAGSIRLLDLLWGVRFDPALVLGPECLCLLGGEVIVVLEIVSASCRWIYDKHGFVEKTYLMLRG
jgi:hypothetical protein